MADVFTLTEARSHFSEIINRIIRKKEKIMITKKGKRVAMVIPMDDPQGPETEKAGGLINAVGALADMEDTIDDMVRDIYEARKKEKSREVLL